MANPTGNPTGNPIKNPSGNPLGKFSCTKPLYRDSIGNAIAPNCNAIYCVVGKTGYCHLIGNSTDNLIGTSSDSIKLY